MNAPIEPRALFENLVVGNAVALSGMEIVPLFARNLAAEAEASFLEDAIREGHTLVNEVGESGIVGQVRVLHRGGLPLLILQGEQILGAKQNRSFNASFVIAPGKEVVLPVSCVEQGRWQRKSAAFEAGATTIAPSLRSKKLKRVSSSMMLRGTYDANQHEVWSGVRDYMEATGAHSMTGSYEDARRVHAAEIEAALEKLAPLGGQIGLAVVRDGHVLVIDVFGSPGLFARAFRKCLRGALSDVSAREKPAGVVPPARELVIQTLERLSKADATRAPSPADGETITGNAESAAYTAAVWNGAVYHCAATG